MEDSAYVRGERSETQSLIPYRRPTGIQEETLVQKDSNYD